ncbi:MAG: hypothetical protein WCF04_09685 [Candidatus Nanopelagicales bacterium]
MTAIATEQLRGRWQQLYEARTDWAERAVAQHLDGFDTEVRDRLASREREATIALYGPTQVGKTTLILKMLGVSEAAAPAVGEVLRGGRSAGESATATAMRYRVSDDAGWAWADGADLLTGASATEIVDRLGALRSSVEAGSRDPGAAPVEVGIPRALLHADAAPLPIRIIDLPGIQSENAAEQAHVWDLAGTHLPHADVIVILGKADSLEFLKPEVLAMPGLLDWWVAPHRFRIVLTHAHLLGTAKEFARTHPAEHIPLHDLRTHYLEQVRTHDFPADITWDQVPDILFPLEYGQSWAAPADGPVRRRVERANSTAFTELRNSLTALASAEARLAQTYHAYQVAAAVPKRHLQEEADALHKIEERIRRVTEQIAAMRAEADLLSRRLDKDSRTLGEANRRVGTPPEWPADSVLREALGEAQGDKWLRNRHHFRWKADQQLMWTFEGALPGEDEVPPFNSRVAVWTKWAEPLIETGILKDGEVDRVKDQVREIIRNTRHLAANAVKQAWYRDSFLWFEWPKGSPEQATEVAVHWFHEGIRGIDESYRQLVPAAEAKCRELGARIEKDSARIDTLLPAKIAELTDQLAEQRREAEETRTRMWHLRQQEDSAAAREGEFDTLLEEARIHRDLQDLEMLGQAETRADRQLQALNHLLTLRTYDRIRGSR